MASSSTDIRLITVHVQSMSGKEMALTIPSDWRVDDIKRDINRRLDGRMSDIDLAMDDKVLNVNHDLKEAGINHGSEIQLIVLANSSDDDSDDDVPHDVPLHKQCIGCDRHNINWKAEPNCRACAAKQAWELDRYNHAFAKAQQRRR